MNDAVSETMATLDVKGILQNDSAPLAEILELRNVALVDKDMRGQVDEILMALPTTLEEAGTSTNEIRARGTALFVIGEDGQAARWLAQGGNAPLTVHLLGLTLIAIGRFEKAAESLGVARQ